MNKWIDKDTSFLSCTILNYTVCYNDQVQELDKKKKDWYIQTQRKKFFEWHS